MTERKTILIVDDSRSNIEFFIAIMGEEYNILSATRGREGLELAYSHQPDLILLDVMMPELDGYEVCERLKQAPETRNIPIIFITVLDHEEDEERGLDAGAIDYIAKPFNIAIVKAKVRNYLAFTTMLQR